MQKFSCIPKKLFKNNIYIYKYTHLSAIGIVIIIFAYKLVVNKLSF